MTNIPSSEDITSEIPLVCICIPTYNAAGTVRQTLESILAQTFTNIVVHVSDNASTDDTLKVIESIVDPRITIHRQDENIGAEGNFTKCLQLATGKYTAIFHADDLYEPDMVSKQVAFLEVNPNVGAVFTEAVTIDAQGVYLGALGRVPQCSSEPALFSFSKLMQAMLLHQNFLVCPSVMARTEIYRDEIREWGSSLFRSASDIDTWLRIASKRPIAVLGEQLMRYRISRAQFSDTIRNRTERADFFLVMDHYLAKADVRDLITKEDLRHYGWLERHERVSRALNLFGLGRVTEAKCLLRSFFCWDAVYAAMHGRRGLVTLAAGALLSALIFTGVTKKSVAMVKAIKRISWK